MEKIYITHINSNENSSIKFFKILMVVEKKRVCDEHLPSKMRNNTHKSA